MTRSRQQPGDTQSLIDARHVDVGRGRLLARRLRAVFAVEDLLAILVELQLGDDAVRRVDADVDLEGCGAEYGRRASTPHPMDEARPIALPQRFLLHLSRMTRRPGARDEGGEATPRPQDCSTDTPPTLRAHRDGMKSLGAQRTAQSSPCWTRSTKRACPTPRPQARRYTRRLVLLTDLRAVRLVARDPLDVNNIPRPHTRAVPRVARG